MFSFCRFIEKLFKSLLNVIYLINLFTFNFDISKIHLYSQLINMIINMKLLELTPIVFKGKNIFYT